MKANTITIRDLCPIITSELRITFDEDPADGTIDVIIPVTADPEKILGDTVLNMSVVLMVVKDYAIVVSTCTRKEMGG